MLRLAASFVLGYHGCDRVVANQLLAGEPFRPSANDYDWLGAGIYFWEANPQRGLAFAERAAKRPKATIKTPAVVGAIIDLGACLDLTTMNGVATVREAHANLTQRMAKAATPMPVNQDTLRRQLDRAVIEQAHLIYDTMGARIDSVRGVFTEGRPVYDGSGFDEETHVQIAIRNPDCIKGVFRVPEAHLGR